MTIRLATESDLAVFIDIERAAGESFARVGMQAVAEDEQDTVEQLEPYQRAGHAWAYVDSDDVPHAYLTADVVDGCGYLAQVAVHPDHAGRRIGRALIENAHAWAAEQGLPAMTLTTFAVVPWNAPYYERLGYRMILPADVTPGLAAIRKREAQRQLDRWVRVCMIRTLP